MRRFLLSSLAISIALLAVQPAAAGEPTAREVELMAMELERLFQPLADSVAKQDLVLIRHGGGVFSLRLGLDVDRSGVEVRAEEKAIRLLDAGHMASEPTSPALAGNAVVSSPETMYNIWWAVVNQGDLEESRRTTIKITGPEDFELQVSDAVTYLPNSVQLFFFNPEVTFSAGGIYTHRTSVKTGGKNLYKFWVE